MTRSKLNWKPVRNGRFYCAPACGGRCTWAAYKQAHANAERLLNKLGPGWKSRVWENLGWYYVIENKKRKLQLTEYLESKISYMAILAGVYIGYGHTPESAIKKACKSAQPYLDDMKAVINCVEDILCQK